MFEGKKLPKQGRNSNQKKGPHLGSRPAPSVTSPPRLAAHLQGASFEWLDIGGRRKKTEPRDRRYQRIRKGGVGCNMEPDPASKDLTLRQMMKFLGCTPSPKQGPLERYLGSMFHQPFFSFKR